MSKKFFDTCFAFSALLLMLPVLIVIYILIWISIPGVSPIFSQKRVGLNGNLFTMYKFRTMIWSDSSNTISVQGDSRITPLGRFLRKYKLDEIPSLVNVLLGNMSIVGPRPDVPGYADKLEGENRKILKLRPGITGPASIKYANEEYLLSKVVDPQNYNDTVIYPDKVKINLKYYYENSIWGDLKIIYKTICGIYGE